jgi:hypothetical protein
MIQRIQTIFLLLAAIAQALFLAYPISYYILESNEAITYYAAGYKNTAGELIAPTLPIHILAWAILGLILTSIFLYKKRILQIRICIYSILLNLGMIGLLVIQTANFSKINAVNAHSYNFTMVLPIAIIILIFLAFRGIRKDELLVKAYDRLR